MKSLFKLSTRSILASAALFLSATMPMIANSSGVAAIDDMDIIGKARMQVLFWNIYDARLYAPDGVWPADGPFALSLTYLRDLQGAKIAERSIQEMRKQGFADERALARWYETLARIIPDVADQNEIIGVADENAYTQFFLDGEFIGEIREPDFTQAFFAIWLDEKTSEPEFRAQLLGETS